jgi:putative RNA 2'-phosphotransferase
MNQAATLKHISKLLSLVLRHAPETIGIELDAQGWVEVDVLLARAAQHGTAISRAQLDEVVRSSDKQRFALSGDGRRIRANQGHSVATVDLGLAPAEPPGLLYHGTAERFVEAIRADGLRPGARQHVHLSREQATAATVGARHGRPVVLVVDAAAMQRQGHAFYVAANGVWLAAAVPASFIGFPSP